MRGREVAREAWRNVSSGAARSVVLAMSTATVAVLLVWLELTSISDLVRESREFREAGASILVLDSNGNVDGSLCERLRATPGVQAAGALRSAGELRPVAAPDNPVPLVEATPGLAALLGASRRPGILVESSTARLLGARGGDYIGTTQGRLPITGTFDYPDDGRDPLLAGAALNVGQPSRRYDQCWLEVWPFAPEHASLLRTALSTSTGADAEVLTGQLNPRLGRELDAPQEFESRPSRWFWLVALATAAAIASAGVRLRRLELALSLHLSVPRPSLVLQVVVETLLWSSVVGVAVAVLIARMTIAEPAGHDLTAYGVRILLGTALGSVLGGAAGAALTREHHLFRYFKDRR